MDTLNTQTDNNQPVNQSSQTVKIRVLIVDDQKIIREGLKVLIQSEADFEVIGTGASGEDAIKLTRQLKPDVILLDVEMPGIDGVTATKQIISEFPEAKILVLSSYDSDKYVSESLDAGAKGYLLKGTPAHEVRDAVRAAYRGYLQIGPSLFDKVMPGNTQSLAQIQDSLPKIRAGGLSVQTDEESSLAETEETGRVVVKPKADISSRFDQPVVLKQSPWAARAAIGTIIGVVLFSMGWSAFAKIEQVVKAKGQLKPKEAVKEINTPVTGVVEKVLVKDGDQVEQDQTLLVFDTDASQAQLQSLNNIRKSLIQENKFYRTLMREPLDTSVVERAIIQLKIPQEVAFLARNRNELIAENNLYQVQLGGSRAIANLRPDELARLRANQAELNSRARAAKLEVEQIEKQLNQNQVQLADAREQLRRDRQVLREIVARNRQAIAQAEASLKIEESILADVSPLLEEGALAKVQIERQKQEVSDRKARLVEQRASGQIEYEKQEQQIQSRLAEIDRLLEEQKRLQLDVAQARQQYINTTATSEKDVRDQIARNNQQIAQIDSQINKVIVENEKRIAEINSQISQAQQTIKYQEVKAPVSGTVFDLKATRGYVPAPNQKEPLLKIVPSDSLTAEVFVTTQDIGFVRPGQKVDIRIDTFPFSEYGDIKGKVVSIGSDALQPDQVYNFFRFPVRIELDNQYLPIEDKKIDLQSGMSVSVNIRVRENRTVLSLFYEQFTNTVETFKDWK